MTKIKTIAVLITSHNRCQITVECMKALGEQSLPAGYRFVVYLVDAGSADGTALVVKSQFPDVKVMVVGESVFWNEGMSIAFSAAMEKGYEFYLWLNDDAALYPGAIASMINVYMAAHERGSESIVVGTMRDSVTLRRTYGGLRSKSKWQPISFTPVLPSEDEQECDTFDGNCVLLPSSVVNKVGNLEPRYWHAMGDTDYGLRAKNMGVMILVAPGYAGICGRNPPPIWSDPAIGFSDRIKSLNSPKGLPPSQWFFFIRRHGGPLWPLYWIKYLQRIIFPDMWSKKS